MYGGITRDKGYKLEQEKVPLDIRKKMRTFSEKDFPEWLHGLHNMKVFKI